MSTNWYKKILTENKKEIIRSAIISLVITVAFSIWFFISHKAFAWNSYHFVSEPTLTLRLLSALVFVSLGRLLYELKFYYFLYFIFVIILRAWELYNALKKIIWYALMFVMGFYIVPWIINVINAVLSFFYNLWFLILYVAPALGIFLLIFLSGSAIHIAIKRHQKL